MTEKIRVGVVGIGYLGQIHAKIYHEMDNVELVMLADTKLESAQVLADQYNCKATDSYLEMVDKVDAVSIVVPTSLHFDVAQPFLESGTATLVEKPIAAMIHDLDLVLSLIDEVPSNVQAIGASVVTDHVDLANVRLDFPGGAVANITASRISNKRFRRFRVFGPEGYYGVNLMDQELDIVTKGETPQDSQFPNLDAQHINFESEQPLQVELAHFVEVAKGNAMPMVTGLQGLRALTLADQIQSIMRDSTTQAF